MQLFLYLDCVPLVVLFSGEPKVGRLGDVYMPPMIVRGQDAVAGEGTGGVGAVEGFAFVGMFEQDTQHFSPQGFLNGHAR